MTKTDISAQREKLLKKRLLKDNLTGYAFLSPNIIGFVIFMLLPVLASFVLAFCEWNLSPISSPEFVGLRNFITLFSDADFWRFLSNTLFYMLGIPVGMATSLLLAILMDRKLKGILFFRAVYFMPVITSIVAVALIWRWIYNPNYGLINIFLRNIGISNPPKWLQSVSWAKPAIMILGIWKGAGYNMLLYLAALQGIPNQLYEAADIDGANSWRKFRHITFPLLAPTNFFIFIMSVIGGFQIFDIIYVMTDHGGPAGSTASIVHYIYMNAFKWNKMGYAATISWFLFIIIFIVTLFNWKYGSKKVETTVG